MEKSCGVPGRLKDTLNSGANVSSLDDLKKSWTCVGLISATGLSQKRVCAIRSSELRPRGPSSI